MNLTERSIEYVNWLQKLRQVTSDATNTPIWEIKINEDEAFKYFASGYTTTQCFREAWENDGD